jgi:hypothetical protein
VLFAYHGYPWLIHRLTYRRTNHANIHVRGYKEEGTTTTPFDMVMMNDLDRYHLVMDVIDRVPGLGQRAAGLRQEMVDTRRRARAWTRGARRRPARGPRLVVVARRQPGTHLVAVDHRPAGHVCRPQLRRAVAGSGGHPDRLLRPGDRRTVGQVDEVVRAVRGQPELAASLVDCLDGVPEALAMRASDALEKVIAADPTIGEPYRARVVQICLGANQKEVQWHLAQLLPVLQPTDGSARPGTGMARAVPHVPEQHRAHLLLAGRRRPC